MHTIEIRLNGRGKRFREISDPLSDDTMLHLRMALAVLLEEQLREPGDAVTKLREWLETMPPNDADKSDYEHGRMETIQTVLRAMKEFQLC